MIITDFDRKLSEAKEEDMPGTIYGDPFYTSPYGYKLKIQEKNGKIIWESTFK